MSSSNPETNMRMFRCTVHIAMSTVRPVDKKVDGQFEIGVSSLSAHQEKMVSLLHTTGFIFSDFNRLPN
jgi:hypothetical protein